MNQRLYYALIAAGFAKDGETTFLTAHGVQSAGITTTFNLEYFFELGQLEIYQTVENLPDIEVNMEKVMDGYPMLYHLMTNGSTVGTLFGRSSVKQTIALSFFDEAHAIASGTPLKECHMSGMYLNSWSLSVPNQGAATETISAVGNNKVWRDSGTIGSGIFNGTFTGSDAPLNFNAASGGIQQRWNVVMTKPTGTFTTDENGATVAPVSVWPKDIRGINSEGINPAGVGGFGYSVPIQSVSVSVDLGRTPLYELGLKSPYIRFINPQVDVRTEIEVNSSEGDFISATEEGGQNGAPVGYNTKNQTIRLVFQDGTVVNTGTRNSLLSVAETGGEASQGAGNVVVRYTYNTKNTLTVSAPHDPAGL